MPKTVQHIQRLRGALKSAGADALVLTTVDNVYYASGFSSVMDGWHLIEPIAAVVIPADDALPVSLFLPEDSDWFFMKFFVQVTDPLIKAFKPITPGFLVAPLVPLYVAWFFYMFRFYVMPWLLGYSVMGMLSFPLEGDIARGLYSIFN